jgi:hypothetical protein
MANGYITELWGGGRDFGEYFLTSLPVSEIK